MEHNENKRFKAIFVENYNGRMCGCTSMIIKDNETGVLYYFIESENGSGLTPLLGKDGAVIIDNE